MKKQGLLKRAARIILIILAALWMLFEDWVWDSILALMQVVARLKIVQAFEDFLRRQNQYLLLTFFVFPFLIMIPAKLLGLYMIASGKILRGAAIFVVAKVTITALVTRLFVISREKLLLIRPFAAFYYWFREAKDRLYAELRKIPAWTRARDAITRFKQELKMRIRMMRRG